MDGGSDLKKDDGEGVVRVLETWDGYSDGAWDGLGWDGVGWGGVGMRIWWDGDEDGVEMGWDGDVSGDGMCIKVV